MGLSLIILAILLIASGWGVKVNKTAEDPLTKEQSRILKAIAAVAIGLDHIAQYMSNPGLLKIFVSTSYLFVGVFFFSSGYGLTCRRIKNGRDLLNRITSVLVPYLLAFCVMTIVGLLLGKISVASQVFEALIGYRLINSSYWFIYTLLWLYCSLYISTRNEKYETVCLAVSAFLYVSLCIATNKSFNWYNSILPFYFGVFVAKKRSECGKNFEFPSKKIVSCLFVFSLVLVAPNIFEIVFGHSEMFMVAMNNIAAVLVLPIMIVLLAKFKIGNRFLKLVGKYSYEIYLYTVICCWITSKLIKNEVIYVLLTVCLICFCSVVFHSVSVCITGFILNLNQKNICRKK